MTSKRTRTRRSPAGITGHWIRTKRRAQIYARDENTCAYCLAVPDARHRQLDHLNAPRDNRSSNLTTTCRSCNSSKKGMGLRKWLKKLRARGVDTRPIVKRLRRMRRRKLR